MFCSILTSIVYVSYAVVAAIRSIYLYFRHDTKKIERYVRIVCFITCYYLFLMGRLEEFYEMDETLLWSMAILAFMWFYIPTVCNKNQYNELMEKYNSKSRSSFDILEENPVRYFLFQLSGIIILGLFVCKFFMEAAIFLYTWWNYY